MGEVNPSPDRYPRGNLTPSPSVWYNGAMDRREDVQELGEECKVRGERGFRWRGFAVSLGVALACLGLLWAGLAAAGVQAAPPPPGGLVPGQVIVKWQEGVEAASAEGFLSERGARVLKQVEGQGLALVSVPPGQEEAFLQAVAGDPRVAYAEPNRWLYACGVPNDPSWPSQWNMVLIQAPAAWDVVTGTAQVVIAFVDTGLNQSHPEFAGRVLPGYDYVNGDTDPEDDNGHGTHAAGIALAQGNNGRGVAGVNWNARILPLKVLDASGRGTYFDTVSAIYFATNQGARILNLSLGGPDPSPSLYEAVRYAVQNGALVFAAAGNDGGAVLYPAAYDEAIAVAATNAWDERAAYSNYGPAVDIAAPGGTSGMPIYSTYLGGGYGYRYGTSMATPHVAGLAGLLWAANPTLSAGEVWALIRDTADKVGTAPYTGGRNDYLGYGRINAQAAVRRADPPVLRVAPGELWFLMDDTWTPPSQGIAIGNGARHVPLTWEAAVTGGSRWVLALPPLSGTLPGGLTHTLWISVDRSSLSYGTHTGRVRVSSATPDVQGSPQGVWVRLTYVRSLSHLYLPLLFAHPPEPEGYLWLDASAGGTAITLGDDDAAQVALPFPFRFYGQVYSSIWVSANGFASFGTGYGGPPYYNNHCLPNSSPPNNAIYAFWDDLDPSLEGGVYVKPFGADTFVIEWQEVPKYGSVSRETFEIVLKADGRIKLQYKEVGTTGSSTVGVENASGSRAQQYLCNGIGGALTNEMALWFTTE